MDKKNKIALAASAGGHISQLLKLSNAWDDFDIFYVTTTDVLKKKLEAKAPAYCVGESNRKHKLLALKIFFRCLSIVLKEKPKAIISTGALHGCLLCYLGKLLCRSKIIWIDSITNTERPSLSGRLVYPIANLFILQWEELLTRYKKAEFHGNII